MCLQAYIYIYIYTLCKTFRWLSRIKRHPRSDIKTTWKHPLAPVSTTIDHHQRSTVVEIRDTASHHVYSFEYTHTSALKSKRSKGEEYNTMPSILDHTFSCGRCDYVCLFYISFYSHERASSPRAAKPSVIRGAFNKFPPFCTGI